SRARASAVCTAGEQTKNPATAGLGLTRINRRSVVPGEGDLLQTLVAEPLRRSRDRLAAERLVEFHRRVVVRQRPDDQRLQPALGEIAPRRREQAAAEAE